MSISLRGFLLGNDREKVAETKGEAGLKTFDEMVGIKRHLPTKYYPIEESLVCLKAAAQIIYGNTSDESYRKLGAWDYRMVAESQAGKVAFTLFAPNLEKALENFSKLMNTFYTGIRCEAQSISNDQSELIIYDDPYPRSYFQGLFEEAVKYYGFNPEVRIKESQGKRIFHITYSK